MSGALRVFALGFAVGSVVMLLACLQPPEIFYQKIGLGCAISAGIALWFWVTMYVIEYALRELRLYGEFLAFLWDRARRRGAKEEAAEEESEVTEVTRATGPSVHLTKVCEECGADPDSEDAPCVWSCKNCNAISCDECGTGGLCSSCDVDNLAEHSDG